MSFSIKTWVDRLSEFPNRRRLDSTGISNTWDVTRSEGAITTEGDKFDAATMNELEGRISSGFADTVPPSRKVAGKPLSSDISLTKADVGLGNVENTADANKNVNLSNYSHYSSHAVASGGSALRNITMSTAAPSGGQDGDIWMQYT